MSHLFSITYTYYALYLYITVQYILQCYTFHINSCYAIYDCKSLLCLLQLYLLCHLLQYIICYAFYSTSCYAIYNPK